ncbi:MAG: hypothetical protein JOZ18_22425 [Chloroflexi bacterium]|nr:hypothetical protein [Chloroflexota bacterium]
MSDLLHYPPALRKQTIELSYEERTQLNSIIDLLIPSDEHFPPPSSLHLIDDFLEHLLPSPENPTNLMLNEKRLRTVLRDLNAAADGNFCKASTQKQQALLRHLERGDPALFQALWTLVNHTYYTHMATRHRLSLS